MIAIILILLYIVFSSIDFAKKTYATTYKRPFILIDAGHGYPDGGAVGTKTEVKESDLNLEYATTLKQLFLSLDYKVELTRNTKSGLDTNKDEDMNKRRKIIETSSCNVFLSLHMNKFSQTSSRGAQTFYKINSEPSKVLAKNITELLCKNLPSSRKLTLGGDYLVLNSAKCPSCLIECGFLSNEDDETMLQTSAYREKLCYAIFCGTVKFLSSQ